MRTSCLSFHAPYRCRHAGECCRAPWDIDVEPHIVQAVMSGQVRVIRSTADPFVCGPESALMTPARTANGDCGFHHDARCSLQEAGSETMLPSACRHFPRVFLRDGRGSLLTLSHYCPTAAALLFDDAPVTIVEAMPPLALEEPIEGLDARDALPPLLRPGMLTDVAAYDRWERAVVREFIDNDADSALDRIAHATERIRSWNPGCETLSARIEEAFAPGRWQADRRPLSPEFALVRELTGPHPLMEVAPDFESSFDVLQQTSADTIRGPVGRYMAACAFGNWLAYRGQGLRSIVGWLRACHDVLRVQLVRAARAHATPFPREALIEAIRMADYIMVHTVDSLAFGRGAAYLER